MNKLKLGLFVFIIFIKYLLKIKVLYSKYIELIIINGKCDIFSIKYKHFGVIINGKFKKYKIIVLYLWEFYACVSSISYICSSYTISF